MKLKPLIIVPRLASMALLATLAVWPVRADYQSSVLSLGPIGYWRFNETSPASPPLNIITNATSLGTNANGICVDNPVKGQPGIIGTSIQFVNPSVSSDVGFLGNKIDVPWSATLNPNPPFTIEFWAKPTALSYDSTGFCPLSNFDPNFSGGSRAGWLFYINDLGTWQFRLGNRGGYAGILTATNGTASPGVWQLIDVTWDGTNATMYANGSMVATAAISSANWVNNPQSFIRFGGTPLTGDNAEANYIAATSNNGNRGYDGYLEEVAIYTNILSQATISAHYAAAGTNSAGYTALILASHPVGYWPMQDAPFTQATGPFPTAVNMGSLGSAANGTNYFGTLIGQSGPGYTGFGPNGKSVFFDGDNGYCQITDTPGLHWATNNGTTINYITMAAWIKPTEQDFFRNIISHGWDVNTGDYAETFLRISRGVGGDFTGDGNYYEVGASDGVNFYDSVLVPIPPGDIGNWVFIAGTFDGSNWNLYRNGQLVGTIPANMGSSGGYNFDDGANNDTGAVDVTNWWTIGSRGTDLNFVGQEMSFGGWITEPALFTNALAPADIANLYAAAEVPPVITEAPVNPGTTFTGSTVSFSVWADGTPTLSYLWYTNGVSTGVTATNYSISDIAPGNYTVSVVVANAYGTNTQSVSFPAVNAPPSITSTPASETRYVGFPFSFTVGAGGTSPLTYYWKLGSTVVQAGPSSTYSNVTSLANAGTYTVIVSNITTTNAVSAPFTLTAIPIPSGYSGVVISNGPIAYWRLNELSGTVAHDDVGGNDGEYFNATLGVPGYSTLSPDTAVTFSGVNSYVGNISGTAINFVGHTNFTLEAWVNAPAGQSDQATIIAKGIGNNGTTETEQFALDVSGGVYRFFNATKGALPVNEVDATEGPNGTWQHIVGIYDDLNTLGAGSNMYIYVNGVLEGTHATYAQGLNNTITPVSIGSKRTGNDPNYDGTFNGTIDEVAVYNYALSGSQVYADYAAAYGTNLAPFITIQPSPTTNYAGLPAEFSVTAAGSVAPTPITYQWYKNNVALSDGGEYLGSTSNLLLITPTSFGDAGNYSVTIVNSVGHTNSISVPLVVLAPPSNAPVIPGLVMHLTFDDTLKDSTGRGNSGVGTYVYNNNVNTNLPYASNSVYAVTNLVAPDTNNPPNNPLFYYVSDGVVGPALHFSTAAIQLTNSTSIGTNDYFVSLGVRPDLQFGSNSFTVSYWIRLPLGFQGGDLPFFTDTPQSTGNNGFVFAPAYAYGTAQPNPVGAGQPDPTQWAGSWGTSIYGGGAGIRLYGNIFAGGAINDAKWHHLVHVVDRTSGHLTTYLDGVVAAYLLEAGTKLNDAGNIDVTNQAVVGQDPTGQYGETGAFDIDDLGVWDRALTALEAETIYIAGVSNQLSFTAPVYLTITPTNSTQLSITWPSGTLQASTNVVGTYTNVTGAVSPYIFSPGGTQKFFRVKQ